jgi:hypothetical protein
MTRVKAELPARSPHGTLDMLSLVDAAGHVVDGIAQESGGA